MIERLVVIAIIAILMAILMTAPALVKEQARPMGSLAHLKQCGLDPSRIIKKVVIAGETPILFQQTNVAVEKCH